eukprot:gene365-3721_t
MKGHAHFLVDFALSRTSSVTPNETNRLSASHESLKFGRTDAMKEPCAVWNNGFPYLFLGILGAAHIDPHQEDDDEKEEQGQEQEEQLPEENDNDDDNNADDEKEKQQEHEEQDDDDDEKEEQGQEKQEQGQEQQEQLQEENDNDDEKEKQQEHEEQDDDDDDDDEKEEQEQQEEQEEQGYQHSEERESNCNNDNQRQIQQRTTATCINNYDKPGSNEVIYIKETLSEICRNKENKHLETSFDLEHNLPTCVVSDSVRNVTDNNNQHPYCSDELADEDEKNLHCIATGGACLACQSKSERKASPLELLIATRRQQTSYTWAWQAVTAIPSIILLPSIGTLLLFAILPLGEPDSNMEEKSVFIMLTNPIVQSVYSGLLVIFFYAILDQHRPWRKFRHYVPPILCCCIAQIITETFPLMGLIPFTVANLSAILSIYTMKLHIAPCKCGFYTDRLKAFCKVVMVVYIFMVVLTIWVIMFDQLGLIFQAFAPIILLFVVFFFKKFMLSITGAYPIEIAMLMSGLWLESLDDPPASPVYQDNNLDDRGHSNERPGYWRRQVHFYAFKMLSQVHGYINYLVVSPALRHGYNARYYPLTIETSMDCLTSERYRISIQFTVISLVLTCITAVIGYRLIRKHRNTTYHELLALYGGLITSPLYYGFVVAILLSSSLQAFSVVQYHNRIWFVTGLPKTPCGNRSSSVVFP